MLTFLGNIGDAAVVYKPIAGKKPLRDCPDGCLAHRKVAAYLVSETLGWNIVPQTWLWLRISRTRVQGGGTSFLSTRVLP